MTYDIRKETVDNVLPPGEAKTTPNIPTPPSLPKRFHSYQQLVCLAGMLRSYPHC